MGGRRNLLQWEAVEFWELLKAARRKTKMHDPIIHTEQAAETQDLGRVAQEKDAPCALPASRKNWESEVKCSCSSSNPLDRTAARPELWQVSDLQPKIRES